MDAIKESGRYPIFESKKDIPAKGITGFTPLQAADILAYEMQKITQQIGKQNDPETFRFRFPFEQLDKIPGEIRMMTPEKAQEVERVLAIDRFFKDNPLT